MTKLEKYSKRIQNMLNEDSEMFVEIKTGSDTDRYRVTTTALKIAIQQAILITMTKEIGGELDKI